MSASIMSTAQFDRACESAAAIGRAVRTARRRMGEKLEVTAVRCSVNWRTLAIIEVGGSPNVKLGNVQKLLDHFGLALVIMPASEAANYEYTRNSRIARER